MTYKCISYSVMILFDFIWMDTITVIFGDDAYELMDVFVRRLA